MPLLLGGECLVDEGMRTELLMPPAPTSIFDSSWPVVAYATARHAFSTA